LCCFLEITFQECARNLYGEAPRASTVAKLDLVWGQIDPGEFTPREYSKLIKGTSIQVKKRGESFRLKRLRKK
jgi:hypothetical protein